MVCEAAAVSALAGAQRHRHVAALSDRPLSIGGSHRSGIYRQGNSIVAPGGFAVHGFGYPLANADERREALYGYGADGIGGTGFENDPATGYNNPYYGNAFNSDVGYNGVPSTLAFGPGYASRDLADRDPADDVDVPSPGQLGYRAHLGGEDD